MAREVDVQLGELFVPLVPTQSELCTSGSQEQYQQLVIFNSLTAKSILAGEKLVATYSIST